MTQRSGERRSGAQGSARTSSRRRKDGLPIGFLTGFPATCQRRTAGSIKKQDLCNDCSISSRNTLPGVTVSRSRAARDGLRSARSWARFQFFSFRLAYNRMVSGVSSELGPARVGLVAYRHIDIATVGIFLQQGHHFLGDPLRIQHDVAHLDAVKRGEVSLTKSSWVWSSQTCTNIFFDTNRRL